jgi:UDP-N-acetylglucosamine--N-acetylmuramyl-(pentapeptide) pyrophosphoryl-undecaprenol N-acetylglucosamine transferase
MVTASTDGPLPRVYLAASGGGHLDLLRSAAPVLEPYERTWLTTPGRAADDLRRHGERVLALPPFDRRNVGGANLRASMGLLLRERPKIVITSGAGVVLAFCAGARAQGARVLFAETMARVDDISQSGRLLARLAHRTLVQWADARRVVPDAVVCRPAMLEGLPSGPTARGEGTFVALGTHHQRFDRLLRAVDDAVARGVLPRPVCGQTGASEHFASAHSDLDLKASRSPDEMRALIGRADVVVAHAGSGVLATALRAGKRPLVLPRLKRFDEHVDDHQEQLARKLDELGLAVLVDGPILDRHIESARRPLDPPAWPPGLPTVTEEIARFAGAATGSVPGAR